VTADEALRNKQRQFAREQGRISEGLDRKYGPALEEKYGQKYRAWKATR
jgi:hypothetical protein